MKYLILLFLLTHISFAQENSKEKNTAPIINIFGEVNSQYAPNQSLDFIGSATDAEDGDVTNGLIWVSSISGQIGTGGFFSKILPPGKHNIKVSVTDSGGAIGSADLVVIIDYPELLVDLSPNKNIFTSKDKLIIYIQTYSIISSIPSVNITTTVKSANNKIQTFTGLTDSTGRIVFTYNINGKSGGIGTYIITTSATKAGYSSTTVSKLIEVQ